MKYFLSSILFSFSFLLSAQSSMSPEMLWSLGRLSPMGITKDKSAIVFRVSRANIDSNSFSSEFFTVSLDGKTTQRISNYTSLLKDKNLSVKGQLLFAKKLKIDKVLGEDFYPDLKKTSAQLYTDLDYRHWDTWNTGNYSHVFYRNANEKEAIDIMPNEPYYCPQAPFGGDEDYIWNNEGTSILYVSKKKTGAAYASSTNTDIYEYNLASKKTTNLTQSNTGYDQAPQFSSLGHLSWLQMKTDGYESDKNDIIIGYKGDTLNLTKSWDGTVASYAWADNAEKIYFTAAIQGTIQLFEINLKVKKGQLPSIKQLSDGQFDITSIIGIVGNKIFVSRTDMNHANEIYSFDLKSKLFSQLSHVNDEMYEKIHLSKVEKRMCKTVDGKSLLSWVIYPPDFDSTKKYPTLLYCQGGPQSPLSQFYSFRWNFQLMAAQGYIVIAPNRRGMPGYGVAWNEAISKDWGGLAMSDYLSAIDDISKEPYVDTNRRGAVGASYGGYSVYYLAGIHQNRFKTFIAHDGVFDLRSMYGTTEEVFFTNHDMGGAYWDKKNPVAMKSYRKFNPINLVGKWNTPIMIVQGGIDYRVPIEQGLEAFQAAKLRGIKSKLLYFPDENHWVLQPQNGLVWQHEFFKWLKETL